MLKSQENGKQINNEIFVKLWIWDLTSILESNQSPFHGQKSLRTNPVLLDKSLNIPASYQVRSVFDKKNEMVMTNVL